MRAAACRCQWRDAAQAHFAAGCQYVYFDGCAASLMDDAAVSFLDGVFPVYTPLPDASEREAPADSVQG